MGKFKSCYPKWPNICSVHVWIGKENYSIFLSGGKMIRKEMYRNWINVLTCNYIHAAVALLQEPSWKKKYMFQHYISIVPISLKSLKKSLIVTTCTSMVSLQKCSVHVVFPMCQTCMQWLQSRLIWHCHSYQVRYSQPENGEKNEVCLCSQHLFT